MSGQDGVRGLCRWAPVLLGLVLGVASSPAAAESAPDGTIAYLAMASGTWQVWVVSADGGAARQVTRSPSEKSRVSWFRGGESLLVNTIDGELLRVDVRTGAEKTVAAPGPGVLDAVLSPDGSQVAYSAPTPEGDDNDLWTLGLDSGEARKIVSLPGLQLEPAWSRDGRWIYFVSSVDSPTRDVWRVPVGRGPLEKMSARSEYSFEVAVGRGGDLAYSNNATGDYEIYVRAGVAAPKRLTSSPGLDGHPSWSDDGAELVFHSSRGGALQVWRLSLSGGDARQLTHQPGGARNPVWRAEGAAR